LPRKGYFEGFIVDAECGYWSTTVYAGQPRCYLPKGTIDLEVDLSFRHPTKVASDGLKLDTLYVTTMVEQLRWSNNTVERVSRVMAAGYLTFDPGVTGIHDPLLAG
jgi:sugar lactone lactonase YvrE